MKLPKIEIFPIYDIPKYNPDAKTDPIVWQNFKRILRATHDTETEYLNVMDCFVESLERHSVSPIALGAFHNSEMVGFSLSWSDEIPDAGLLDGLYVAPEWQRKFGIGTRLVEMSEKIISLHNSKIMLSTKVKNIPYYESRGYSICMGDGEYYVMQKSLSQKALFGGVREILPMFNPTDQFKEDCFKILYSTSHDGVGSRSDSGSICHNLRAHRMPTFVCFVDGVGRGFMQCFSPNDTRSATIMHAYVHADCHKQKIGTDLLGVSMGFMKNLGVKEVSVLSTALGEKLYCPNGFKEFSPGASLLQKTL